MREVVREIVVSGKDITSVAQPLFVIDRQDSNLQSFHRKERLILPRKDSLYHQCLFGSPGKTRTCNLAVNSRSLYH